ncbi:hypothetical protein ETU10_07170 [Apibacter muscae]|uniref:hypothetical protein n=1 Tax=Apibacter muscae TaxID=2509004 RepID=UPI0011AD17DA|nr:hypothetical protein [Apibacter muscae]TWP23496.1 hypothetical protein ETU10_07170 [Apibacter muscae]
MRKNKIYNQEALQELQKKYGFTRDYIIKSIKGERIGTYPLRIQEEYKQLDDAAKLAIRKQSEKQLNN